MAAEDWITGEDEQRYFDELDRAEADRLLQRKKEENFRTNIRCDHCDRKLTRDQIPGSLRLMNYKRWRKAREGDPENELGFQRIGPTCWKKNIEE